MIGVDLPAPFPRFSYAEVMDRYGSDKPDLRIEGMELTDLSELLKETTFAPYASRCWRAGKVKGIVVRGGGAISRERPRRTAGVRQTLWRCGAGLDQTRR